jgi:hypothetical protein
VGNAFRLSNRAWGAPSHRMNGERDWVTDANAMLLPAACSTVTFKSWENTVPPNVVGEQLTVTATVSTTRLLSSVREPIVTVVPLGEVAAVPAAGTRARARRREVRGVRVSEACSETSFGGLGRAVATRRSPGGRARASQSARVEMRKRCLPGQPPS